MRALVIDDAVQARVREILEHSAGNWYRPGKSENPPGEDPRHVVMLNTYRCVFSYTDIHDCLWRHLSVSVPSKNYPNPFAIYTIAELFGFTGWDGTSEKPPADWLMDVNKIEHCVVVAQKTESK